jgi:hypothetical protein
MKRGVARAGAWEHLVNLRADVVLVQEAGFPIPGVRQCVAGRKHEQRDWGTAVISYGPKLSDLPQPVRPSGTRREFAVPDAARLGTLALAVVDIPGVQPVLAVSLHGRPRYAVQSMLRAVSDLLPIFRTPIGNRVLLAGDLNMHTAARDPAERSRTVHILGLLEAFGLQDLVQCAKAKGILTQEAEGCRCKFQPCSHVRTHRHPRHRRDAVGSLDYMFASAELVGCLESLVVLNGDDDPAWRHSDHAPMIAEFRF